MKDILIVVAVIALLWYFFVRDTDDGLPCGNLIRIDDYRRRQQQPVP